MPLSYHEHQTNHCPGCNRTNWLIGRLTAECAFCGTALPLAIVDHGRKPIVNHRNAAPLWAA